MKWLIFLIAIIILLLLATGVFSQFDLFPVVPALLVIFTAAVIALDENPVRFFVVIVSGVLLDFVSGLPDGIHLLALGICALFLYVLLNWWIHREFQWWVLLLSVGLATLVYFVLVLILAAGFSAVGIETSLLPGGFGLSHLIWYLILNLALAYPVYWYYLLVKEAERYFARPRNLPEIK